MQSNQAQVDNSLMGLCMHQVINLVFSVTVKTLESQRKSHYNKYPGPIYIHFPEKQKNDEIKENTFIIAAAMQSIARELRACKHNQGKIS